MDRHDLIRRRVALGLSQAGLARLLGMSRAAVCRWESGSRPIPALLEANLQQLEREEGERDGR